MEFTTLRDLLLHLNMIEGQHYELVTEENHPRLSRHPLNDWYDDDDNPELSYGKVIQMLQPYDIQLGAQLYRIKSIHYADNGHGIKEWVTSMIDLKTMPSTWHSCEMRLLLPYHQDFYPSSHPKT